MLGFPLGDNMRCKLLLGFFGYFGKLLESDGGVNQVAEYEPSRFRLAAQKRVCRFIKKGFGKLRIAFNALNDGLLEVAS